MSTTIGVVDPAFVNQCKRTQKLRGMYYDVVPPLTDIREQKMFVLSQKRLLNEDIFEELMENCQHKPLNLAMEPVFAQVFNAYRTIFWKYDVYTNSFYSHTLETRLEGDDTIIPAALQAKMPLNVASIENRIARQKLQVESRSPQLVFPLYLKNGDTIAVIQISRNKGEPTFTDDDIKDATFFMKKFALYGTSVAVSSTQIDTANNLSIVRKTKDVINSLSSVYKTVFEAKDVDFWCYREKENSFFRYDYKEDNFMAVRKNKVGVVGFALMTKVSITERNVKFHSNYHSSVDGNAAEPIMIHIEKLDEIVYAIALRGKSSEGYFSNDQRQTMERISPFAVLSIAYSFKLHPLPKRTTQDTSKPIFDLISFAKEVLKLSEIDKVAVFIENWLSNNFEKVVSVCIKFGKTLVSGYGGDELSLNITGMNDSLMGLCISEQKVQFYDTSDPLFNPAVDSKGNRDVSEVILVPIFSAANETLGAVSVSSKEEFGEIADLVVRKLSAFAVFCGIAIQNALALRVASFCPNMILKAKSEKITSQQEAVDLAFDCFSEIKGVLSASVFLSNGKGGIDKIAGAGNPIDESSDYAILSYKENSPKIFRIPDAAEKPSSPVNDEDPKPAEQINNVQNNDNNADTEQNSQESSNQNENNTEDTNNKENKEPTNNDPLNEPKSEEIKANENQTDNQVEKPNAESNNKCEKKEMPNSVPPTPEVDERGNPVFNQHQIPNINTQNRAMTPYADFYGSYFICSPIISESGNTIGVFQYCVYGPDSIVNAISKAANAAARVSQIAGAEKLVNEMNNEGLENIEGNSVPDSLKTGIDFLSEDFDSSQFNQRELAIAVAEFIEKDGLSKALNINIGLFIEFVREILQNCNATFHDYHHSIDVLTQCIQMCKSSYGQVLLPIERLSLYIAAISHDSLHDGFVNLKLGTPYECLLKFSPMEMRSVDFLRQSVEKFEFLTEKDAKNELLSEASRFILATDMSKHFDLIEEAKKLADSDNFSFEDKETRMKTTEILIKSADLGSANRNGDKADKKGLPDEFFAEGDLSKVKDIVYDKEGNERKNIHWGDSEIPFMNDVLVPTFETLAMLLPDLEDMLKQVKENVEKWSNQ
ncbi:3'5'-cyclic nucleotide phosphodiesterase family protein [Trichomonas vaginalis G3]|uniref:3'5'-cyclic nucleotide phosphodiesterase family protein n=1 Tax=Trichomonas vaginalis (strain ATCC PRA-98 / G3) TaxID=412133 RepID=A2DCH1_TRIV3|nr:3',5'-cyclic-nucleotide phosphodiesterase protein [Trichomonas vaginalis G3]EAY21908.1 3'5'-cyclic nucleotide phosphodiesterase family protein [Trichomonas vaginalis G3]KAI5487618.1 3',5'-cyclic-nucleotide phosphodiesterase protein [Trichomonas vaginalis G3]|eukprot:XP_001582894.1 3'5'-cyclic nucleotide phosphodiesterase family protein [Trichomonas vaginalis G3]